ncbi:MAG: helix-turn-helix transcriptional regulator [Candidatus Gastranaerophilales bacterium]|nr:helix-turn-helix transcriptional regulator [Candidatus Gastranaerophilales bacterium]
MDGIGYKIKKVRKALELSQIDMAKELSTTERTLRDYEKERFGVGYDFLIKLVERYNVNPNWLFKNEWPMFLEEDKETGIKKIPSEKKENLIYIPKFEVKAAAGAGACVETEALEYLVAFDQSTLRKILGYISKSIYAITASGDSMLPFINDGDLLLVDHSKTMPQDGVYVLRIDETLIVKRIQCLPNNRLKVMSDNPVYQPYEVDFKTDNVQIIGKVIWQGKHVG